MAHDVFVSYASPDKPTADAVVATLERHRIRCWIAPRDVLPGQDYPQALINAINGARAMVLVFSANANSSDMVMRELERAAAKGIPILPFRIEDVVPTQGIEFFIAARHWLDALTPPLERHLEQLAPSVAMLLSASHQPGDVAGGESAARERRAPSSVASPSLGHASPLPGLWRERPSVAVAMGAGALAVLAIVAFVAIQLIDGGGGEPTAQGNAPAAVADSESGSGEASPTSAPAGSVKAAGGLTLASTMPGEISVAPEKDVYSFDATQGTEIAVAVTVTSGDLDPEFSIHRPDGSELCSRGTTGTIATESCFPDTSGTYTIRIGDRGEDDTGAYDAFLQVVSSASSGPLATPTPPTPTPGTPTPTPTPTPTVAATSGPNATVLSVEFEASSCMWPSAWVSFSWSNAPGTSSFQMRMVQVDTGVSSVQGPWDRATSDSGIERDPISLLLQKPQAGEQWEVTVTGFNEDSVVLWQAHSMATVPQLPNGC